MSEEAFREGLYQNNFGNQRPGQWPIKVENYKGEPLGTWTLEEWKTKLAELQPAKERTRADELADLEALKNDGILDDDEYRAKLAELQDDEPPAKKAKTEEEDYEALTVTKLKAKSKERGLAATGEKGILIWRLKLKDRHATLCCSDGADPFSFRGAALKKAAARHGVNCMGSPEEMLEGIVKKLAAEAPAKPALEDDGSQDAIKAATRVLELAAEDAWEEILSLGAPGKTLVLRGNQPVRRVHVDGVEIDATIHERAVNLISTQADGDVAPERFAGGL